MVAFAPNPFDPYGAYKPPEESTCEKSNFTIGGVEYEFWFYKQEDKQYVCSWKCMPCGVSDYLLTPFKSPEEAWVHALTHVSQHAKVWHSETWGETCLASPHLPEWCD